MEWKENKYGKEITFYQDWNGKHGIIGWKHGDHGNYHIIHQDTGENYSKHDCYSFDYEEFNKEIKKLYDK